MAGIAGMEPMVMSTADMAVMAFGCSVVRNESACEAFTSQTGACATVVVAR